MTNPVTSVAHESSSAENNFSNRTAFDPQADGMAAFPRLAKVLAFHVLLLALLPGAWQPPFGESVLLVSETRAQRRAR